MFVFLITTVVSPRLDNSPAVAVAIHSQSSAEHQKVNVEADCPNILETSETTGGQPNKVMHSNHFLHTYIMYLKLIKQ